MNVFGTVFKVVWLGEKKVFRCLVPTWGITCHEICNIVEMDIMDYSKFESRIKVKALWRKHGNGPYL